MIIIEECPYFDECSIIEDFQKGCDCSCLDCDFYIDTFLEIYFDE